MLQEFLNEKKISLRVKADSAAQLAELRKMYEPYVHAISLRLHLALPPWVPKMNSIDNWQVSAWGKGGGFKQDGSREKHHDQTHF